MSLFIPSLFSPFKVIRDVTIPSYGITKAFIIPSFPTLVDAGDPQPGAIVFIVSLNQVRIGTTSGWSIVSGSSSTLASAPGSLGASLVASGVAPNLLVKGIVGGSGVTVTSTATDVVITGNVTPSLTAGSGISIIGLVVNNTNPGVVYTPGNGVALTVNDFTNTGVIQISPLNNTLSVSGGIQNRIVTGNYQSGSGISIVGNVINNLSNGTVLSVTAGDTTVVVGGTLNNPTVQGNYTAGTNIDITGNVISILGGGVTGISNSDGTITVSGPPTMPTLTGNYQGGSNVSITTNTIDTTPYPTSLTSGDTIVNVVGSGTPTPTIALSYSAGTDVSIVGNTINSTLVGVDQLVAADNTVVVGGTVSNPTVRCDYVGGSGISITGTNVIDAPNPFVSTITADPNNTLSVTGTSNVTITGNYQSGTGITIVGNVINSSSPVPPTGSRQQIINFSHGPSGTSITSSLNITFLVGSNSQVSEIPNVNGGFPTLLGYYIADSMMINSFIALMTPIQQSGITLIARVLMNGNPVANLTMNTTDSQMVFPVPFYIPGGSMLYVALRKVTGVIPLPYTIYPTYSVNMEPGQTSAIAAPSNPSGASFSSTSSSIGINVAGMSGTSTGIRVIYKTGSPPSSWTDPTGTQVYEYRSYGNRITLFGLSSGTTYFMLIFFINSNTPPTMSTTPVSLSFATL
jgi:hypothetical protein